MKGTFTVVSEGKTFATVADPANITGLVEVAGGASTDVGAEFTAIGNWSCSQKSVTLSVPMVVTEAVVTPLTVVMDAKLLAFSTPYRGVPRPAAQRPGYFGATVVPTFHVNSDGSVAFVTGGSLDDSAAIFQHFVVGDHVGVVENRSAGTWSYHAMQLPSMP